VPGDPYYSCILVLRYGTSGTRPGLSAVAVDRRGLGPDRLRDDLRRRVVDRLRDPDRELVVGDTEHLALPHFGAVGLAEQAANQRIDCPGGGVDRPEHPERCATIGVGADGLPQVGIVYPLLWGVNDVPRQV